MKTILSVTTEWMQRALASNVVSAQDMMERMEVRDVEGFLAVVRNLSDFSEHLEHLHQEILKGVDPGEALTQLFGNAICTALLLGAVLGKEDLL